MSDAKPYTLEEFEENHNDTGRLRATVKALARAEARVAELSDRLECAVLHTEACHLGRQADENGRAYDDCDCGAENWITERDSLRERAEAAERECAALLKTNIQQTKVNAEHRARAEAAEKALGEAREHIEKAKLPPVGWLDCRIPGHGANRDEMLQAQRERDEARAERDVWKQRATDARVQHLNELAARLAKSEAAAAALREGLEQTKEISQAMAYDYTGSMLGPHNLWLSLEMAPKAKAIADAALASDAGRGWLPPEGVEKVREALVRLQHDASFMCCQRSVGGR